MNPNQVEAFWVGWIGLLCPYRSVKPAGAVHVQRPWGERAVSKMMTAAVRHGAVYPPYYEVGRDGGRWGGEKKRDDDGEKRGQAEGEVRGGCHEHSRRRRSAGNELLNDG